MLLNLGKYYDKKLWAEAVQTFVYLKNRQPHSALKDQTPYEAFHGTKPSIHHLQPFGRECYPHIPEATRRTGKKLAPRARLGLFVGYTKVDHHYRVFLPDEKRTVVSADVFFPPFNSEGATTKDVPSKTSTSPTPKAKLTDLSKTPNLDTDVIDVNIDYDGLWIDWMKRHPAEANMLFQRGDPTVQRLMQQEYERGYRDTFLSREFWGDALDDNDTPSPDTSTNFNQHQQQPPSPPPQLPSRSPSPTPMEGLSQRSIQSPQPQVEQPQQSSPQPEQPTTTVTRYGRVVRPPGAWWEVQQQQTAEPEPATSGPMVLTDSTGAEVPIASDGELDERLDDAFTAVLSALEPQTFRQAQRSSNWDEWKVSMDEE